MAAVNPLIQKVNLGTSNLQRTNREPTMMSEVFRGINAIMSTMQAIGTLSYFSTPVPKEKPVEPPSTYQHIQTALQHAFTLTVKDATLIVYTVLVTYFICRLFKRTKTEKPVVQEARPQVVSIGPTIYNGNMNIQIWLSEVQEFIEANRVKDDNTKQEIVLARLDTKSQATIQKLIESRKVCTFKDLMQYLKSFFGRESHTNANNVIRFMERKQFPNESLNEFHSALQELAFTAHPRMEKTQRDEIAKEQFVRGLRNQAVKNQLRLKWKENEKMDVLAEAIDLNSILPIEDDSEPIAIQHIQANHYNVPMQPIVQHQQYQTVPFSQPQIIQHDPNAQHRSTPI